MSNRREEQHGWLRILGMAMQDQIDKRLTALPNNTFERSGTDIYYKDKAGTLKIVFSTDELYGNRLSPHEAFNAEGIVHLTRNTGETVFLTRTPDEHWLRVWVPLTSDPYEVKALLKKYNGLQTIPFDEVATLPIQIGGQKGRELLEKAAYFELNLTESGIGQRFPTPSPLVEKFVANAYGKPPTQLELPHKGL